MAKITQERLDLLKKHVPELFSHPGMILYIGAYPAHFFASLPLWKSGNRITVLEVWEPFLDGLKASRFKSRCEEFLLGDIRAFSTSHQFDYVLWFHGPEHIPADDLAPMLSRLEKIALKMVVLTCPYGKFRQGEVYDNPHTEHLSHHLPDVFEKLGYNTATLGQINTKNSQLQAWKRL